MNKLERKLLVRATQIAATREYFTREELQIIRKVLKRLSS